MIFPVGIMVVLLLHAGVSKKGEYSDEAWWLADVADGEPNAMYVDIYGEIHEEGKSFYKTNMGVRPVMWLKLD